MNAEVEEAAQSGNAWVHELEYEQLCSISAVEQKHHAHWQYAWQLRIERVLTTGAGDDGALRPLV